VVGFYHSHFPEAYLRGSARFFGQPATAGIMKLARSYVRKLYNQFEATLVPSEPLAAILTKWGLTNVRMVQLGVNTEIFRPDPDDRAATRDRLGVPQDRCLFLYVGRLAKEKNTQQLFDAFDLLQSRRPGDFHLLVIGDGPQRKGLIELQKKWGNVSWLQYCTDSSELARHYRAAHLFVHPGVQETFGLVALESQACGTPVVGIKGSHMDRIILHDQVSWAEQNTKEALARAMEDSSAREMATLRAEMVRTAWEIYSWPQVFAQLFCIYRGVCAEYAHRNGNHR
jgi:alpha-1,6-mannosyltransferase